jgi:hypothetical protein
VLSKTSGRCLSPPPILTRLSWAVSRSLHRIHDYFFRPSVVRTWKHWSESYDTTSSQSDYFTSLDARLSGQSGLLSRELSRVKASLSSLSELLDICGEICMTLLNWLLFLLAMAILFLIGTWAFDRAVPVTFHQALVETPIVAPGGILRVHYQVTRHRNCSVHIEQVLFDENGGRYPMPDTVFLVDPGQVGEDAYSVLVPVPNFFTPGRGRFRSARAYFCNPLQRFFNWPVVVPPYEGKANDVPFTVGYVNPP